ncbi:MAG: hypothetical protein ALAOOOJD_04251 [bacterium]|nr:hypothetical protein [bacterium]
MAHSDNSIRVRPAAQKNFSCQITQNCLILQSSHFLGWRMISKTNCNVMQKCDGIKNCNDKILKASKERCE